MSHRRVFLLAGFAAVVLPSLRAEPARATLPGAEKTATALANELAGESAKLPRNSLYQLDLKLTDQDGRASLWADAAKRTGTPPGARLVSMFYTHCDMVCPMLFEAIRQLEQGLPPAARSNLQVGLISLDPQRDDVATLQKTAAQRAGDAKRWRLYRTQTQDVRQIAALLGVKYHKLANGEFSHSTPIILLDAQGVELARTEKIVQPEPDFLKSLRIATQAG